MRHTMPARCCFLWPQFSDIEPYTNAVERQGGRTQHFATMERPKLLFADSSHPHRPTHLVNGVSPVWDANNSSDPCAQCGNCCHCKVTSRARGDAVDLDWTYTLVRPLAAG